MKRVVKLINVAIDSAPFNGVQNALAVKAGIDRAQLHRVLDPDNPLTPSPRLVGRIAAALPKREAAALIQSFLQAVAAEVAEHQAAVTK
jgi:hypothetical protein